LYYFFPRHINERKTDDAGINIFYSTPSCYLKSLHDANITWPEKTDDFFPYSSDPHAFWTGYFTSRPTQKRYERMGNHFLQVCKQLSSIAPVHENSFERRLDTLRDAMGMMQHHDAITGTEKQHVADDYARLLHAAINNCGDNAKSALAQFSTGLQPDAIKDKDGIQFDSCLHLNISVCNEYEDKQQFTVTVYNALAHSREEYIRVPVSGFRYLVQDYRGQMIEHQVVPISESVIGIHHRKSKAAYEIVFMATEIPPLGYKSFFISKVAEKSYVKGKPIVRNNPKVVEIGNDNIKVRFEDNGFISNVVVDGIEYKFSQNFVLYEGAVGNNQVFENRSSGAYIFRPKPNTTERIVSRSADIKVMKGKYVDEVHQIFNDWISQVVRVYKSERFVEFEWLVGPIPIDDNTGKEISSRFYTNMKTNGIFYTDSNGREMLKRLRNHRPTWNVDLKEEIAGNYYPINTKVAIEDEEVRLSVLTDRAQGGSSVYDGTVELMVHRRLLHDDAFGVGEALNETAFGRGLVARGKHYLFLGKKFQKSPTLQAQERFLQNEVLIPSWLFFSDTSKMSYNEWTEKFTNIVSNRKFSLTKI
jgi:lysosomal alpha-mannosidase